MDGNQSMEGIGDIAMSLANDMGQTNKAKAWNPGQGKAAQDYRERRKIAEQLKAERQANKGQQITEAEYQQRKARLGRPPKYRPEYCKTVIELSEQGLSLTAIAGKLKVTRDTLWTWGQTHPAFSNALKIAKPVRVSYLEEGMLSEDSGPRINARIFALKNAAPEEWSDRQNIEINQTVNVAVTFSSMLDGLCATVIDGVLEGERVTQPNDINELQHSTTDTEAIGAIPPMYIEHSRGANEGASEPPLVAKEPQPVAVDTAPSTNSKNKK